MWGRGFRAGNCWEWKNNCTVKGCYGSRVRGDQVALLIQAQGLGPAATARGIGPVHESPQSAIHTPCTTARLRWAGCGGRAPYEQGVTK